jgi:serine/threonine protein phosphatase PrpC
MDLCARGFGFASVGDSSLPQVTANPNVVHKELTEQDEFLILACDGLWDVMTDQQAVRN